MIHEPDSIHRIRPYILERRIGQQKTSSTYYIMVHMYNPTHMDGSSPHIPCATAFTRWIHTNVLIHCPARHFQPSLKNHTSLH